MDPPIRQALGSTLQIAYTRLIVLSNFRTFVVSRRRQLGLALLSGVLYFVGFCGFGQWYLSWFCLVPILLALDDETLSAKQALGIAWFFGLVAHMGGYYWITYMLHNFGHLPIPVAVLGWILLCIVQGSLLGVWGWAIHIFRGRWRIPLWVSAAPVMILAEWMWPALFPSYLSNSQFKQIWLIQSLELMGPLGLTGLMTFSSAILFQAHQWHWKSDRPFPVRGAALLVALFIANLGFGVYATDAIDARVAEIPKKIKVGLVQANMGIYEKRSAPGEGLKRHREQSLEMQWQEADLIVWPESGYFYSIRKGTKNLKRQVMGQLQKPLLFGGLTVESPGKDRKFFNSAYLLDGEGNVQGTYDKTYLLAFGEYIPFGDVFPWIYKLSPNTGKFTPGNHTKPIELDGIKYGVLICYEDILPGFVHKLMKHQPDILVNITNDAWFGDTHEPIIHLALATFRAVEQRRFLARSTNTGISAFVDPAGRIVSQTPTFKRANLMEELTPLQGITLYQQLGNWPGAASIVLMLGLVFLYKPKD